jgi:hypothetical protein
MKIYYLLYTKYSMNPFKPFEPFSNYNSKVFLIICQCSMLNVSRRYLNKTRDRGLKRIAYKHRVCVCVCLMVKKGKSVIS